MSRLLSFIIRLRSLRRALCCANLHTHDYITNLPFDRSFELLNPDYTIEIATQRKQFFPPESHGK